MKKILSMLVGFLMLQGVASASLVITNVSFENPILADGGFDAGAVPGWTESGGIIGYFNPNNTYYTSADTIDTNPSGGTLGDMDGRQVLFFADDTDEFVSQTLTDSVVVGSTYTLTVAVGDRDTGGRPGFAGYDLRLFAGGIELDKLQSSTSPGDGTFTDVQFSYKAQAGDSGLLGIQFGTFGAGAGKSTDFDNVRLDSVLVPEPTTIGMLGLGALIILLIRKLRFS